LIEKLSYRLSIFFKSSGIASCSLALLLVSILLLSNLDLQGQYYGMKFKGHNVPPNQRSGLHIVNAQPLDIKKGLDLQFFLRFAPEQVSYYGYIFRLILGDQNIDLVHQSVEGIPNNFRLVIGEQTSKIIFSLPFEELRKEWVKLRFELDFINHQITCHIDDRIFTEVLSDLEDFKNYHLLFGTNSFGNFTATDIPGMIIRDVEVRSNKQAWHWPLDETEGSIAHSQPPGNSVTAINPGWLLKDHSTWNSLVTKSIPAQIKMAFDAKHDKLYLVSKDSIYVYSIAKDSMDITAHYSPSHIESPNHLIYDTISDQLLLYSLMDDYLSLYDKEAKEWTPVTPGDKRTTYYWHHNHFFTPDGVLLTMGGYGNHTYLNSVREWNVDSGRFTQLEYQGIYGPRYLAAAGFNPRDSLYYLLGGYGSNSGQQAESPDYYYELLSYSANSRTFSKLFDFQDIGEDFCFSNSAIIDKANNLYALRYSKHLFDNQLQLIGINIDKPEIIEVGNKIDYTFLDIRSYSDLHFSKPLNALVALSSYTADNQTQVSVHSIAYPPQPNTKPASENEENNRKLLAALGLILICLIVASLLFYFLRKRDRKPSQRSIPREALQNKKENSIILFGGFQVFDQSGQDITGQFSPLLKNLFLYILMHSLRDDKGVSNDTLYETFWFDKTVESARNNRSVNIIKLKSILENVGSSSISKETGYQKFYSKSDQLWIDYQDFLKIIRQESDLSREQIIELLSIIDNKPFLKNTQADWLDPFKSEVSNDIIDALLNYINRSDNDDADFLLHLTNCIFMCDTVSEEALKAQCRLLVKQGKLSLAKNSYTRFVKEYKALYGEDYKFNFKQILEDQQGIDDL